MSTQPSLLGGGDRVVDVDITDRLERSFLDYSMSVIVGRALPDVRDGLKPVQRRIVYAMWEAGLRPGRPHRKCSSVIGDVMKKYHPHGDSSIYETLVRLAQDFTTRDPLIDGRGNFGSVDGDSAAAHRYTEALLTPVAMALLDGIDEDVVDFSENYDGEELEPVVLPARLPNLLLNGASGIAVGMATNIPPHNLREVVDACLRVLDDPDVDLDDLMAIVPAPDFPTGARILDTDGIRDAYETGRGAVTMEAVATTETRSGGMPRIVVTEIPYQVNKATLLEKIAGLVKDRKIESIRDLRDESSRDGMRVVIELKRGEDPAATLAALYDRTELRTSFHVNLVALVDGTPRTLGLRECLVSYVAHQREVVTRRTRYRRDRAAERAHVLEGLLIALDNLDEVIALIRAAASAAVAREQLMDRYGMTEIQATAVLDTQLRRLAQLERERIAAEHAELTVMIAELETILADPGRRDALLAGELAALRDEHATPRRSRLTGPAGTTQADELPTLDAQQVTVYVTRDGWIKPLAQRPTSAPHRPTRDPLVAVLRASADDTLLLVDVDGGGYRADLSAVEVTTSRQRGAALEQLLGDPPDAALVGAIRLPAADEPGSDDSVVTVSRRGLVKRSPVEEYWGRTRAMVAVGVRDDDELVAVLRCSEDDELMLAHDGGQVIRFPAVDVRLTGRAASGVSGVGVPDGRSVVAASVVGGGSEVLTVDRSGATKRTRLDEYPVQGRGGKGVTAGVERLAWCGVAPAVHIAGDSQAVVYRTVEASLARRGAAPVSTTLAPGDGRAVPEQSG